jgi:hypothetical protein
VTRDDTSGADLNDVLLAVEKAAPVDAVHAVTRSIGVSLDASWVSFLVADMSGRALVRLVHVPIGARSGGRRQDEDVAMVLPFDGGPQEQALRAQRVLVEYVGGQHVVRAPVTQRGETIGLLEIALGIAPADTVVQRVSRAAHTLAFVVIANRRHTDLFEWGQRTKPFTSPRRSSGGSCRRRSPAPRRDPARTGAGRGRRAHRRRRRRVALRHRAARAPTRHHPPHHGRRGAPPGQPVGGG